MQTPPLWLRMTIVATAVVVVLFLCRHPLSLFVRGVGGSRSVSSNHRCETPVHERQLSSETVRQLAAMPLRSQRARVEALLGSPYCQLPNVSVRTELKSVRFLYQQPGDHSWLVVMYEGTEYVGSASSDRPPTTVK